MSDKRTYQYEAMFIIGQSQSADLSGVIAHINDVLARGHAEVIAMKKWDERRLAYEIRGQKRGLYILVYFRAPGMDVAHIERDCNLSEKILRTLILRADHLTAEEMQAADGRKELEIEAKMRAERPATPAPATAPAAPAMAEAGAGDAEPQ
jgi:small subunit ribosomal protein S6